MYTRTISSKGQVTIPKKIRDYLKVGEYDRIVFIPLEEGKVVITNRQNSASELFGMLKHRKFSEPVSLAEMKSAIRSRRVKRVVK